MKNISEYIIDFVLNKYIMKTYIYIISLGMEVVVKKATCIYTRKCQDDEKKKAWCSISHTKITYTFFLYKSIAYTLSLTTKIAYMFAKINLDIMTIYSFDLGGQKEHNRDLWKARALVDNQIKSYLLYLLAHNPPSFCSLLLLLATPSRSARARL